MDRHRHVISARAGHLLNHQQSLKIGGDMLFEKIWQGRFCQLLQDIKRQPLFTVKIKFFVPAQLFPYH